MIIGIASQKQHGKSTCADYLQKSLIEKTGLDWQQCSFADKLKDTFCDLFGVTRAYIEEYKVREDFIPPGFNMNVRRSLEKFGGEMRAIYGNVWIDYALQKSPGSYKIIPDVRHLNEAIAIQKLGGIVCLISRPHFINDSEAQSEKELRPYLQYAEDEDFMDGEIKADRYPCFPFAPQFLFNLYLQNDGTISDFYHKIDDWIVPIVLSKLDRTQMIHAQEELDY